MKPADFLDLVVRMRGAQRAYFRERKAGNDAGQLLSEARELERRVDRAIEEAAAAERAEQARESQARFRAQLSAREADELAELRDLAAILVGRRRR